MRRLNPGNADAAVRQNPVRHLLVRWHLHESPPWPGGMATSEWTHAGTESRPFRSTFRISLQAAHERSIVRDAVERSRARLRLCAVAAQSHADGVCRRPACQRCAAAARHRLRRRPQCRSARASRLDRRRDRPVARHAARRTATAHDRSARTQPRPGAGADGTPADRRRQHGLHRRARHLEPGPHDRAVSRRGARSRTRGAARRFALRVHLLAFDAARCRSTAARRELRLHPLLGRAADLSHRRRARRGACGRRLLGGPVHPDRGAQPASQGAVYVGGAPVFIEGAFRYSGKGDV